MCQGSLGIRKYDACRYNGGIDITVSFQLAEVMYSNDSSTRLETTIPIAYHLDV